MAGLSFFIYSEDEAVRTLVRERLEATGLVQLASTVSEPSELAEPVLLWHASPFGSQDAASIPDPQGGPSLVPPLPQPLPKEPHQAT